MSNRRVESFLLRVVVGDSDHLAPEVWRGRIQHVGTGDERHFQCIEDAIAFIREQFAEDFARFTVEIEDRRPSPLA